VSSYQCNLKKNRKTIIENVIYVFKKKEPIASSPF